MKVECQNCEWKGDYDEATDIDLSFERFEIGDTFSDKECPKCGAICLPARVETAVERKRVNVHFAIVRRKSGYESYTAGTKDELYAKLAEYAKSNWHDDDVPSLSNDELVRLYFSRGSNCEELYRDFDTVDAVVVQS